MGGLKSQAQYDIVNTANATSKIKLAPCTTDDRRFCQVQSHVT